nr:immunoglobulin heavy chain junction region [Mus musculus]MBK4188164.1 immunoglobulin heavy chain junction region [Mus musculus]MBK4188165.1 immunoglobulin heavy chain junction region [Mus musculus]MBK4188166.1 immunoglobulin heavy chain junction region [Mus musculus]MBK4188167.1 immunoglobulin heavy chain junction region [Mus musculus]
CARRGYSNYDALDYW